MTAPFMSSWLEIEPGWIDHNNHMNMGYYTVLFDRAVGEVFARLGFGPDYVAARNLSTFSADVLIRYVRELKLGARVRSSFYLLDHDDKSFHTFQQLFHEDGWLAATGESVTLHVDLSGPRVAPMPADILARVSAMAADHAGLPRPDGIGGKIGIRRKS